jgi:hypothetical protein
VHRDTSKSRRLVLAGIRSLARLPRTWAAIAVALALAGCSGPADTGGGEGEAEIGTGMFGFAPLADGATLELVNGPQGGFHFIVHARMRGLSPGDPRRPELATNPTTWFRALDEDGNRVDIPEVRQLGYAPQTGTEDWYILPSGRLLLIDNLAAPGLYGRFVTIEVQIRDAAGRTAGDTARVMVVAYEPPPGMRADAGAPAPPAPDASLPDAGPAGPLDATAGLADDD